MKKKNPYEARAAENQYARSLRGVAKEIGKIIDTYGVIELPVLLNALRRYTEILKPWAKSAALVMIEQVDRKNKRAWKNMSKEISLGIQKELRETPIGQRVQELMEQQVKLITSLPEQAAERVHDLVRGNVAGRSKQLVEEIRKSGEVTEARATLIARTEVSRATTILTQARAEFVGSEGYIWRTAHDSDVRKSHRKMEGKFVRWDNPPTLDNLTGHAGALPNCRCYPEPVIPKGD